MCYGAARTRFTIFERVGLYTLNNNTVYNSLTTLYDDDIFKGDDSSLCMWAHDVYSI